MLGLIFLKFADNKYRQHEDAILAEYQKLKGKRRERSLQDIAIEKCGFALGPQARYDYLLSLPEKEDIPKAIRAAMASIEQSKPELLGVLPQEYDRFSSFIEKKLAEMLAQNATRSDFAQRFQAVINAYNSGATATEDYYQQFTAYVADLQREAERHVREGLTEDELELFDLLDWYKDVQTQKVVRSEMDRVLGEGLPETYERALFKQKCDNVFELTIDYASRWRKWAA